MEFDVSEVKFYPGSIKGPRPEDDPRAYTKWFVENQPKKAFEGVTRYHDFEEFGVTKKNIDVIKDETIRLEIHNPAFALKEDVRLYPKYAF
jgi:hypothetical protein